MFQNMTVEAMHQQLPVWVLSLARATRRRQHVIQTVRDAGVLLHNVLHNASIIMISSRLDASNPAPCPASCAVAQSTHRSSCVEGVEGVFHWCARQACILSLSD
jgi:hypothetical protein